LVDFCSSPWSSNLQSQPPFAFSLASIHLYGFILAVNVCTTIENNEYIYFGF